MPTKKTVKKTASSKSRPAQKSKTSRTVRKTSAKKAAPSKSVTRWIKANIAVVAVVVIVALLAGAWVLGNKNDDQGNVASGSNSDASMRLVGPVHTPKIGEAFTVSIYADSKATNVNAVQATLVYPSDVLSLQSVKGDSSAYPIDAHQSVDDGRVEIVRGVIGGVTDDKKVSDVVFVAKKAGNVSLEYDEKGTLLLSSASNVNILGGNSFNNTKFEVTNGN